METRNIRKERIGVVTSNKMEKSVIVSEVKRVKHSMYGKFVLKTKKYVAHDEKNDCLACEIGTKWKNISSECDICGKGMYQDQRGKTECNECSMYTFLQDGQLVVQNIS